MPLHRETFITVSSLVARARELRGLGYHSFTLADMPDHPQSIDNMRWVGFVCFRRAGDDEDRYDLEMVSHTEPTYDPLKLEGYPELVDAYYADAG